MSTAVRVRRVIGQRLANVASRLVWHPSVKPSTAIEMRAAVAGLPPVEGDDWWSGARRELRRHILRDDPARFLRWPVVRRTLTENEFGYINAELQALDGCELREDPLGAPAPFPRNLRSSGTLIHHSYVVKRFEQTAGIAAADVGTVVEFGGGYGSLARLFRRRGHTGTYHIHDFPELGALQRFYLTNVCGDTGFSFSQCVADAPTPELFVASNSLSEAPADDREPWLASISRARYALIVYAAVPFANVDNSEWFRRLQERAPGTWIQEPLPLKPGLFTLIKTAGR